MAGLDATGFTKKTFSDLTAERDQEIKDKFGDGSLVGTGNEDSGFTQFVVLESERDALSWDELEAIFNNQDPNSALDASLDALGAYLGLVRLPAAKTKNDPAVAQGVVTGTNGTIVTAGSVVSVVGTSTSRFVILANATITGGTANVDYEAESIGPITYPEGIAGFIETPITGWDTFTFAGAGSTVLGRNTETNEEFRIRIANFTVKRGGSQLDSMTAAFVQEVDGIATGDVFIKENPSDVTVGALPPHSMRVVARVGKGSDQGIGDKLFEIKPAGIQTVGSVSVNVTDQQGNSQTVKFDRATLIPVFYIYNLTVDPSKFPQDQDEGKATIKTAAKTESEVLFTLGKNIINHKVEGFADDAVAGILTIQVLQSRDAGPPTLTDNLVMAEDEEPTFDTGGMVVNIP